MKLSLVLMSRSSNQLGRPNPTRKEIRLQDDDARAAAKYGPGMTSRRAALLREAALLAFVAAALLLDGAVGPAGDGLSVLGVLAVAFLVGVLALRRRAPLTVVPLVLLGIAACLQTISPGDTVFVPGVVAAYSVAAYGDRRRSLLLAAVLLPVVMGFVVGFSPDGLLSGRVLFNAGVVAGALVVGDSVRARRAARAADAERRAHEIRERELEARRRVVEERLRIARDVHDVVAHSIVAINVQAGVAAHLLRSHPENAEAALREIKRVSGTALTDLRATLGVLRADDPSGASPLRPVDPLERVEDLAEAVRATGVAVDVRVHGDRSAVPTAVGSAAYRIVQEALTNVARHAGAASSDVRLDVGPEHLAISVTDDGRGAGSAGAGSPGSGVGLQGIRERAAAVGGRAEAGPGPDGGWAVTARLPVGAPAGGAA
jgi:signal transduction histidine kinase